MNIQPPNHSGKGAYLGTEINGIWWKRYMKDHMFIRGNGEYWLDETGLHFRRYLTKKPISFPYAKIKTVTTGKWHAGKWLLNQDILKITWANKNYPDLCSGFVMGEKTDDLLKMISEKIST